MFITDNKERIILYRGRGPFEDTVWGCSLARSVVIFCPIPVVAAVPRGVQGAGGGGRGHVVHEPPWGGHSEGGCGAVPVGRSGGVRAAPCAVTRRPAARHGMVSRVERFIKDIGRLPFDITQFIVGLLQLETYKTFFFKNPNFMNPCVFSQCIAKNEYIIFELLVRVTIIEQVLLRQGYL